MLAGLTTYNVSASARKPLVDFMTSSLEDAGCRLLFCSDTKRAPFVITFETAAGERLGIVVYAFLATRTPTKNRPEDERSFQIKYASKTNRLHELWMDPLGLYTTLLIGIDPKGFFVAADPAAHNPTKFFIRLEFKDKHASAIQEQGWYAWERGRRTKGFDEPVEVLVGGTRERFLDLVRFERAAAGLAPGDRQLLAEKREFLNLSSSRALSGSKDFEGRDWHPLARELALAPAQILELIANARRLKMAVRGWVAEEHLRDALCKVPGVTRCERLDVEGGPDIHLSYRGGPLLTIECKNVLRVTDREGRPRIDFQRTRASKSNPCSRYYAPGDFNIVAGCLHAITEKWEFRYALTSELPEHAKCAGKISNNIRVDTKWNADPTAVFERACAALR